MNKYKLILSLTLSEKASLSKNLNYIKIKNNFDKIEIRIVNSSKEKNVLLRKNKKYDINKIMKDMISKESYKLFINEIRS